MRVETVIKHIDLGYTLGICDPNERWTWHKGTPEIRLQEAEESAKFLGMAFRINLGMADGFFGVSQRKHPEIDWSYRACKPKIVIGNAILDPTSWSWTSFKAYQWSLFLFRIAENRNFMEGTPQNRHRPNAVYHYIQDKSINAVLWWISHHFSKKAMQLKFLGLNF